MPAASAGPLRVAEQNRASLAPLAAVAAVAARLAAADSLDVELPAVLTLVTDALGGDEAAIWVRGSAGPLRLAGSSGAALDAVIVEPLLDGAPPPAGVAARAIAVGGGGQGVLVVTGLGPLDTERLLLFDTAAQLLGPAIAHDRQRRQLEHEVASRVQQINDERRFTERIIDSLPFGLYVIDRDYRIEVWNRKRETGLQGVSREEAVGRTIFEILHRQPAQMLRSEFDDVLRTGTVHTFSMESNSTGDLRYYRITKIPMCADDDTVSHVITVGEDVTEWREAQERFAQAEKLAAIGQLAAGVMHEINNPLATIAACAESLSLALDDARRDDAPVAAESGEYLRIVESEVQRCKRIVDRLLEFSRPKPLAPEPVDVNAVVEQTLFLLKHHSRFKQFTVDVDLTEPAPVTRGNTEQLVQVLMALLINAMDAMENRGTIAVRTRRLTGPPAQALIEVRDHGHGIARSQLAKIFEPFYTTKAPGRGTGLGLSICYGIVAEHGGRMEVDSTLEDGSTFRVLLPAGEVS